MKLTFPKKERLTSKKTIDRLFTEGKNFSAFPLVLKYELSSTAEVVEPLVQIAISVPKRKVKFAVDRNRLKRQLREAYRLNKSQLLEKVNKLNQSLALFLIYNGGETADYHLLETKLKVLLNKVENLIE